MTKLILVTRPCHDRGTQYLHFLSGELIREIESVGEVSIIDLEGSKATRDEFEKALQKGNPRLVVLNGHGSLNSVTGHDNKIILDKDNVKHLNSKIIYAVVCDSSLELGEFAVDEGKAESYIGYEAKFMIVIEPDRSATPAKDRNFKPFREVYVMLVLSLLSGYTVSDSVERTKNHTRQLIKEYGVRGIRDKFGDAPLIRFSLYWDLFYFKMNGNPGAKF